MADVFGCGTACRLSMVGHWCSLHAQQSPLKAANGPFESVCTAVCGCPGCVSGHEAHTVGSPCVQGGGGGRVRGAQDAAVTTQFVCDTSKLGGVLSQTKHMGCQWLEGSLPSQASFQDVCAGVDWFTSHDAFSFDVQLAHHCESNPHVPSPQGWSVSVADGHVWFTWSRCQFWPLPMAIYSTIYIWSLHLQGLSTGLLVSVSRKPIPVPVPNSGLAPRWTLERQKRVWQHVPSHQSGRLQQIAFYRVYQLQSCATMSNTTSCSQSHPSATLLTHILA